MGMTPCRSRRLYRRAFGEINTPRLTHDGQPVAKGE